MFLLEPEFTGRARVSEWVEHDFTGLAYSDHDLPA
jgi:hypothetical protein